MKRGLMSEKIIRSGGVDGLRVHVGSDELRAPFLTLYQAFASAQLTQHLLLLKKKKH